LQVDNSYLYREGDRYVIFDETGPGVVWRIWMMGLDGLFQGALASDVRVELNEEPRPRLALDRKALFAGPGRRSSRRWPEIVPYRAGATTRSCPFPSRGGCASRPRPSRTGCRSRSRTCRRTRPPRVSNPGADTTPIAALLAAAGSPDASVVPTATDDVLVSVVAGSDAVLWGHAGRAPSCR
jgi:hypothetical protein